MTTALDGITVVDLTQGKAGSADDVRAPYEKGVIFTDETCQA